jgi:DHA3 family macrolide efflux protein-like MFS transporter
METAKIASNSLGSNFTKNNKKTNEKEKLNITLYLISKTISLLGSNIYNFALSLYILKVTGSGSSFAINVLLGMLPRIVLGPFAGILADRVNRKKLTVLFDILSGLIVFSFLGLSSFYGLRIIFIYVTGFILSVINVFYDTSLTSSLPNLVRDEKLMKINSYTNLATSLSGVLSPILAGVIYGFVPINIFLIVNGASFIFSSILEVFIDFNLNKTLEAFSKAAMTFSVFKMELKEVLTFVKEQEVMYSFLKYVLMINLFLSASMGVVYPYIINKVLGMSSAQYGTFQGFYFIGMIVCSIVIGNQKEKNKKVKSLAVSLATLGALLILIAVPTIGFSLFKIKPILMGYNILLLFTLGVILISINTPMLVAMQRLTPENLRGRITGILGTLSGGIAPLGIILAGLLIDKLPPFIILSVSGVCIIIAAMRMYKSKFENIF